MQRYLITCILANTIANILYFLEIGFTIELHCAPKEAHKKGNKKPALTRHFRLLFSYSGIKVSPQISQVSLPNCVNNLTVLLSSRKNSVTALR